MIEPIELAPSHVALRDEIAAERKAQGAIETCKGCKQETHPAYLSRYGGYCLDCSNAGVPELMEQIDGMEGEARQAQERIAVLETAMKQIHKLSTVLSPRDMYGHLTQIAALSAAMDGAK